MFRIALILLLAAVVLYLTLRLLRKKPAYQSVTRRTRFRTVTHIVDGDTFRVSPGWKWNGFKGDTIRPTGYDTPSAESPGSVRHPTG